MTCFSFKKWCIIKSFTNPKPSLVYRYKVRKIFMYNFFSDESVSTPNCEKSKKVFDLSNKVKVWSDFLRPHLHHKTIYLMREICHQDNTSVAKEEDVKIGWSFQEGIAAMKRQDTNEEICDRIRLLSESSGSLQVCKNLFHQ